MSSIRGSVHVNGAADTAKAVGARWRQLGQEARLSWQKKAEVERQLCEKDQRKWEYEFAQLEKKKQAEAPVEEQPMSRDERRCENPAAVNGSLLPADIETLPVLFYQG